MRTAFVLPTCAALFGLTPILAPLAQAAPQARDSASEEYLPLRATLQVRGRAEPQEGCSQHGFLVVWEADLEPVDDPEGGFPARLYEGDGPFSTLRFDDWVCRQEGLDDLRFAHKLGQRPTGVARLVLAPDDWRGAGGVPRFEFSGFELGYIHISQDETEPSGIGIEVEWGPVSLAPPLALARQDFERGFHRAFRAASETSDAEESSSFLGLSYSLQDEYEIEATLSLSYKEDTGKPRVELAGCAHLLPGGSERLTAKGTPTGGRYRWRAEPSGVLGMSGTGSSADARAGSPGHATVRVEYELRNGEKAEAALPGSVVRLGSVNGGAAIPTLYRYDAYGSATPPTVVPTTQEPPDGELLTFVIADPAVVTVENLGSSLLVQGVRDGTTTAQAQTKCGQKTGPMIALRVAGCDPEMIAKLRQRYKEVKKELDESGRRVKQTITSEKFNEASDGIGDAVVDVAVEAIDTAAAGVAKLGAATKAVKAAAKAISVGSKGWDAYREGLDATLIKTSTELLLPGAGTVISTYDKLSAVGKLLKYTEALVDADERLAREQPVQDGYMKELDQIDQLIEKCKREGRGGQQPPKEPPAPKPGPTPPKPPAPPQDRPGGDNPAPAEPASPGQPPPSEPPVEPPPRPPPLPKPGAGAAGLPIDCGCPESPTTAWRNEKTGLAAIAASLSLLQGCAESYAAEIDLFQADSAAIVSAVRSIESAFDVPGEKGFEQFRDALPGIESAGKSWERLSKASEAFASTVEGCDKQMPEAASLIREAGQALETTARGTKTE